MSRKLLFGALLAFTVAYVGCKPNAVSDPATEAVVDEHDGHDHHHHHAVHGPHDGELVLLSGEEEYHAEWVHDSAAGKTNIYLLGKDAESAVRTAADKLIVTVEGLKEPKTYELTPVDADAKGLASQFESAEPDLPIDLQASSGEGVVATIRVEIDGKMREGKVEEHDHHHGHSH